MALEPQTPAPAAAPAVAAGAATEPSLLDRLLVQGKLARASADSTEAEQQRKAAVVLVNQFVDQVMTNTANARNDVVSRIQLCIDELDDRISAQLNEVMHDPAFQRLEASWTGLRELVMNSETGERLRLRLLNVSKADLLKDLTSAIEFDQSGLFKKIYEDEYGTFGGFPFSVLVGDYEFDASHMDVVLLGAISNVAAAAHAPFIAAASPGMFNLDGFPDLPLPRDLAKIFDSSDYIEWKTFRESEDSRYVTLTLPRVLQRLPYGGPDVPPRTTVPVDGMKFREDVDGFDHSKYLWGNPAYKLAQKITTAHSLYGWTAAIRGVEGGGKVEGLPSFTFTTHEGDKVQTCPTETAITDRREKELDDLGFVALMHCKGTNYAAFFGGHTTQKPKTDWSTDSANANADLSAKLPYVLTASRFAHYIKAMMRDKVGSFMTRENVQFFLNSWLGLYVLGKDDAGQDLKARFPLREARVDVFDVPGKPGQYRATVFLRPHFQLEGLTASIRLVAELPPPVAA